MGVRYRERGKGDMSQWMFAGGGLLFLGIIVGYLYGRSKGRQEVVLEHFIIMEQQAREQVRALLGEEEEGKPEEVKH